MENGTCRWWLQKWLVVGANLTNDFSPSIEIRWTVRFALIQIRIKWSKPCSHSATAVLSWHVQRFVMICSARKELHQNEFSLRKKGSSRNGFFKDILVLVIQVCTVLSKRPETLFQLIIYPVYTDHCSVKKNNCVAENIVPCETIFWLTLAPTSVVLRKLPRATTNVQKNKSYVGLFISYVGLFISYVGLFISYVGLYNSYVGDKIS